MSYNDYKSALRLGQREYRACVSRGEYPYLQALDELLAHEKPRGETSLGLVDIPMEQIAGTKTVGRVSAFARNFMPLLEGECEFSAKWTALSDAHLEEGIRDPIVAYEYMNRFYVLEGNKRVSVLKFFGANMVAGTVTRILPQIRETVESRVYCEFLDFYRLTKINYLTFRQPGRYRALLAAAGESEEVWTPQQRADFSSAYSIFRRAFESLGGAALDETPAEALLAYLKLYGYETLKGQSENEVREALSKSWSEITARSVEKPVELFLTPQPAPPKTIFDKLLGGRGGPVKVAFVHAKTAATSKWTDSHERGRLRLEEAMAGRVETFRIDGIEEEGAGGALENAVEAGSQVVFTTTPNFLPATIRAAVKHPEVKFLNCSLNIPHPSIRTYYGRRYEAEFLTGIIAGTLTGEGRIGYIADYPVCGMIANINAFALGARMVNPRARVYLEWTSQREMGEIMERFRGLGADVVSNQDIFSRQRERQEFGLSYVHNGTVGLMAATAWNWGAFYELILRSILDGGWRAAVGREPPKAVNYWWGLSAGVVDVHYTKNLPIGTKRLVEFLRESLISGAFRPFAGRLFATGHRVVQEDGELSPEQIVQMDWLAENVEGGIPHVGELNPAARTLVSIQGARAEDRREAT